MPPHAHNSTHAVGRVCEPDGSSGRAPAEYSTWQGFSVLRHVGLGTRTEGDEVPTEAADGDRA